LARRPARAGGLQRAAALESGLAAGRGGKASV